jgi:hypothetical protein
MFGSPTFAEAMSAVSTIVFAFAGAPAFFSIASEMRNPRDYTKSLVIAQVVVSLVYLVIGVVVYYYCGSFVASPALGSAGVTMKKVCYGIALPGLVASVMLFVHVSLLKNPLAGANVDTRIVASQELFHAIHAWLSPPDLEHSHPLGCVVGLHWWHHPCRLPDRLRYSSLRRPHLPRWCCLRHPDDGM